MSRHQYEAELQDGRKVAFETPHHHDDHARNVWMDHVIDILKSVISGVATHHITKLNYKGKVPR